MGQKQQQQIGELETRLAAAEVRTAWAVALHNDLAEATLDQGVLDLEDTGRYEGDLLATLTYAPLLDHKRPWRVEVFSWRMPWDRGDGVGNPGVWRKADRIFDEPKAVRTFKTSYPAVRHLTAVRAQANAAWIDRKIKDLGTVDHSTRIA